MTDHLTNFVIDMLEKYKVIQIVPLGKPKDFPRESKATRF